MNSKNLIIIIITLITFFGCKEEKEDFTICTLEFVYGLHITLVETNTTKPATGAINVTIKDGAYEEVLQNIESSVPFFGAGERPGTYVVTVTSENYNTFVSEPLVVTANECHVIPVTNTFELTLK